MYKTSILALGALALALTGQSPASAGWGCAYGASRIDGIAGRQWGHTSEQAARTATLNACLNRKSKNCHVIGCSNNVDSKEDADRLWSQTPGLKYDPCGGKGQPKC